jgi:outer membrane protein
MRARAAPFCAIPFLLLSVGGARAAEPPAAPQPRLEIGIGGLAMVLPDYRGSDQYGTRALPIPYVVYRTERVQLSREGLRARLFSLDRLSASVSAAASLPGVQDNPDRAGMPQLDPTFEIGPSLDYVLHGEEEAPVRLKLRLPARAVTAADGRHLKDIGWTFVPHLRLDLSHRQGRLQWSHLGSLGLIWATEDYHEYFYGVAPHYADPALDRPAYDAHGGYSGARLTFSSVVRRARWRLGLFASYDALAGATFADSPLVKTEHGLTGGLFVTYRVHASGVGTPLDTEE